MIQQRTDVVIASRCAWNLHNFRRNLIHRTKERGASVVALGAELGDFSTRLRDQAVDFRPIPLPIKGLSPLGDFKLTIALFLQFRRLRPRVAHMFTIKPVIYGTLAAAAAGVPVRICTITGLGHAFIDAGPWVRFTAKTLYRISLATAHIVYFQNQDDHALFIKEGLVSMAKARVVGGSGVDLERFTPQPIQPGLGERPIRFLMLSRLIREKGVMEFVAAAAAAAAIHPMEFRLVGSTDAHNPTDLTPGELETIRTSPVIRHDAVEDVREHLAWADVVVLPSYREGTPRALLEAMATARAIVTTDAAGCRDLVRAGANGLLVPPRDAGALALAMVELASDATRLTRMGAAGRQIVEVDFDERSVIAVTLDAYGLQANA